VNGESDLDQSIDHRDSPTMSVRHISSQKDLTALLESKRSGLVVIDFWATWCQPCHVIGPTFDALAKSYPHVAFVKVDTDRCADIAQKYNVRTTPTFIFIKEGSVVNTVLGPDKDGLRSGVNEHAPGGSSSGESSKVSLLEYLDRPQVNCLNESSEHTLKSILSGTTANTTAAYVESDADEQLLMNIPFNQAVRVQAISIKAGELAHAPKLIKIAVNNPHIGFDDIESANEPQVAQVLELTEEQVTDGSPIPLRFVRFQAVSSLHIFVASNHGGEDETRINAIDVLGLPGQVSRVDELRAREES